MKRVLRGMSVGNEFESEKYFFLCLLRITSILCSQLYANGTLQILFSLFLAFEYMSRRCWNKTNPNEAHVLCEDPWKSPRLVISWIYSTSFDKSFRFLSCLDTNRRKNAVYGI